MRSRVVWSAGFVDACRLLIIIRLYVCSAAAAAVAVVVVYCVID